MLMDTGLQAQGMAVALTRFRFQRRQQLFSQLLAAVLGIDIARFISPKPSSLRTIAPQPTASPCGLRIARAMTVCGGSWLRSSRWLLSAG